MAKCSLHGSLKIKNRYVPKKWLSPRVLSYFKIYTVSQDGAFFRWAYALHPLTNGEADQKQNEESMRWRVMEKHYFSQAKIRIKCAVFHALSGLLVVGSSSGIFSLYELPDFSLIHTLRSVY